MAGVSIPLPPLVQRLLDCGVISIGSHTTNQGTESWVRCLQPHPRLGITTTQSFTVDEAEGALAKLDRPIHIKMTLGPEGGVKLKRVEPPPTESNTLTLQEAERIAPKFTEKKGVKSELPTDSLTIRDLRLLNQLQLRARAVVVASKLGNSKIVSRISCSRTLRKAGATNLEEWWKNATPKERFTILSVSKKSGLTPEFNDPFETCFEGMRNLSAPFRVAEALLSGEDLEEIPDTDEESS